MSEIAELIKKYPHCHIYYHDNGAWIIYQTQPMDWDEWVEFHRDAEYEAYEAYRDSLKLAEGFDGDASGYVPILTDALAEVLELTTDSE